MPTRGGASGSNRCTWRLRVSYRHSSSSPAGGMDIGASSLTRPRRPATRCDGLGQSQSLRASSGSAPVHGSGGSSGSGSRTWSTTSTIGVSGSDGGAVVGGDVGGGDVGSVVGAAGPDGLGEALRGDWAPPLGALGGSEGAVG